MTPLFDPYQASSWKFITESHAHMRLKQDSEAGIQRQLQFLVRRARARSDSRQWNRDLVFEILYSVVVVIVSKLRAR